MLIPTQIVTDFYRFLNNIAARSIGNSDKLPVATNHWYEPIPQTQGKFFNLFLPLKITTKPSMQSHNEELSNIGYGITGHKITHRGVKLNNQQFDRYKELYNYPSRGGDLFYGSDEGLSAKESFMEFLESDIYLDIPEEDILARQQAVDRWHNERVKNSKRYFIREYPL